LPSPFPEARRRARRALAFDEHDPNGHHAMTDDRRQERRDIRAAVIFGVVAASVEIGLLLYFFR
jgi:hypothetical protein